MPTATVGNFTITYTLRTNADPHADIQFGMDFTVTQTKSPLPLSQLIYPATAVGTNIPGRWNVDNHLKPSPDSACLIFNGATGGTITDIPTEISRRNNGVLKTKFSVYRVDTGKNTVYMDGVTFGYSIDTGATNPETTFTGFTKIRLPNDQKQVMLAQCSAAKFA
ncbi:hypothetical protein [Rhodospirillum sp. A1_3_36]|uniref:hypothetical protein n=1 Tax=Rhodospirillum sp. A1_3_36 TaxID=3391666 RepID=UPI0039A63722